MRPPTSKSWLASQGKLPLAFMALALLWLALATVLLVAKSGLLGAAHWMPASIAITHSWMLGFFATVACGAVYQLVPVALSTTLWSERLGWAHFVLHLVGVPGMVMAFWGYHLEWVAYSGAAVILGVVFFALNTWITVGRSRRRDVIAKGIFLSVIWLVITVLFGLFLALNKTLGWVSGDPLPLLRAHAHIGFVGFFVTLIQGVGFQLVPMFTMGQVKDWRSAKAGVWLGQGGLLVLIPGLLGQLTALCVTGGILITLGLLGSAQGLAQALKTRKKKKLDPGVEVFLRGGVGIIVAGALGTVLSAMGPERGMASTGFGPMVYAVAAIFGGLLPCVAGMMCKVVPFLTWMRCYGPLVGRVKTPPAHSLTRPKLERWALTVQQIAAVPMMIGAWVGLQAWMFAGAALLAAGCLLFLIDMFGVFRHLWAPVVTADSPPLFPKSNPVSS